MSKGKGRQAHVCIKISLSSAAFINYKDAHPPDYRAQSI
jgi:hypothetical protein